MVLFARLPNHHLPPPSLPPSPLSPSLFALITVLLQGVALGTITLPKSKSTNIDVVLVRLRETGSFGFGFGTASNGVKVVAVIDHDGVAFDKLHVGDVIS